MNHGFCTKSDYCEWKYAVNWNLQVVGKVWTCSISLITLFGLLAWHVWFINVWMCDGFSHKGKPPKNKSLGAIQSTRRRKSRPILENQVTHAESARHAASQSDRRRWALNLKNWNTDRQTSWRFLCINIPQNSEKCADTFLAPYKAKRGSWYQLKFSLHL